uniref:RNase H type-1 domain-containing protein n=1 Tax=Arion vulgaris TaxID=1028688 RepID=A0A0B7B5R0_9EUPU
MQLIQNMTIQTLIFVSGYSEVKGNERANALASNADIENGPSIDKSDIINALKSKAKGFTSLYRV